VIEATEQRFGRLNVMVANAGIGILCKAIEMSLPNCRRQTLEAAPSLSRLQSPVFEDRQVWPAIAPPKEACACSPKPSRWSARQKAMGSGSTRSIPGLRYADLDEDLEFRGPQQANRPKRSVQIGGAARPGGASAGYRKRRPVPCFGRIQLHDRRRACDRWRHDRRRSTALELIMVKGRALGGTDVVTESGLTTGGFVDGLATVDRVCSSMQSGPPRM
jgi:hypothetical protein